MGKNYIATTNDNLETVLKKIKTGDTLLLFYYSSHKQVDINLLPVFARSGIRLELRELPEKNAEMFLAFELGKLSSSGSVTSISDDTIVSQFSDMMNAPASKPRKPREKKQEVQEKKEAEKPQAFPMPEPIEEQPVKEDKAEKSVPSEPDDFDKAFDAFVDHLNTYKPVNNFNPSASVQKVLEVIKEVEINKGNMLAVCTAIFGSNKDAAHSFIEKNYKVLKPLA